MRLHNLRMVPLTEAALPPGVSLEPDLPELYEKSDLPLHTERCAECLYPERCEADKTCWNDPEASKPRRLLKPDRWTQQGVIDRLREFAKEHQEVPTRQDLSALGFTLSQVVSLFGSWNAAVEAAGFERYQRWGHVRSVPEDLR